MFLEAVMIECPELWSRFFMIGEWTVKRKGLAVRFLAGYDCSVSMMNFYFNRIRPGFFMMKRSATGPIKLRRRRMIGGEEWLLTETSASWS
jgi:hypothetical protein